MTEKPNCQPDGLTKGPMKPSKLLKFPIVIWQALPKWLLKDHVADKTNWRTMLKNDIVDENLVEWREQLKQYIPEEAKDYFIANKYRNQYRVSSHYNIQKSRKVSISIKHQIIQVY